MREDLNLRSATSGDAEDSRLLYPLTKVGATLTKHAPIGPGRRMARYAMVRVVRFERTISSTQNWRINQTFLHPRSNTIHPPSRAVKSRSCGSWEESEHEGIMLRRIYLVNNSFGGPGEIRTRNIPVRTGIL